MVEYILFIICIILFLIVFFLMCFYYPIKNFYIYKHYVDYYGRQVYLIARDYDYYLINTLSLKLTDLSNVKLDHVLFGNKYIYLIKDRYYRGGLIAKEDDNSWVYYAKKGKRYLKEYIDNPLKLNDIRRNKISQALGIDKSLFISIVVINDDCYISSLEIKSKDNFIVPLAKLYKLIKNLENRDVNPLNEEQLKNAVQDIYRLNMTKVKNG